MHWDGLSNSHFQAAGDVWFVNVASHLSEFRGPRFSCKFGPESLDRRNPQPSTQAGKRSGFVFGLLTVTSMPRSTFLRQPTRTSQHKSPDSVVSKGPGGLDSPLGPGTPLVAEGRLGGWRPCIKSSLAIISGHVEGSLKAP